MCLYGFHLIIGSSFLLEQGLFTIAVSARRAENDPFMENIAFNQKNLPN
jgi:hypothetical protein